MTAITVVILFAGTCIWLGWKKKTRFGLIAALALSTFISILATVAVSVPSDTGGFWVFGLTFVILLVVSFGSLGIGLCLRNFARRKSAADEKEKA